MSLFLEHLGWIQNEICSYVHDLPTNRDREIDIKIREKTIDKKECIFCVFIEEGNMIF